MTEEERDFLFCFGCSLQDKRLNSFPDTFWFSRPMGRMHTGMATVKRPRPDGRVKLKKIHRGNVSLASEVRPEAQTWSWIFTLPAVG